MFTDETLITRQDQQMMYDEKIIQTIQKRFTTYGYQRIKTPAFERYDLYAQSTTAINRKETVKLIDREGEVFVLRPDVTIPLTKQLADCYSTLPAELKYYYIQDVFRQSQVTDKNIETTQAGVEYYCEQAPEKDAEVLALACQTLIDLGFQRVKIEIGHAGFVQSLIEKACFSERDELKVKGFIQSKNVSDLQAFLQSIQLDEALQHALMTIPFLYGNPFQVCERARGIAETAEMQEAVAYLLELCDLLTVYGIEEQLIVDFGLINHMGYYSGVIFQGFVEQIGQPVVMGGRYHHLGALFDATLPAIGFACHVEAIANAKNDQVPQELPLVDVHIIYDQSNLKASIRLANQLRKAAKKVITTQLGSVQSIFYQAVVQVELTEDTYSLDYGEGIATFTEIDECVAKIING